MALIYGTLNMFVCLFLKNIAAHFKILQYKLENIANCTEDINKNITTNEVQEKMNSIIKEHNKIINNVKEVNYIFSTSALVDLVLGSLVICSYTVQLIVNIYFSFTLLTISKISRISRDVESTK